MRRFRFLAPLALVLPVTLFFSAPVRAQDTDSTVELLRSDLKTKKVELLTDALEMTPEQANVFWPIYRQYEGELDKIRDQRLALLKEYDAVSESITPEQLKSMVGKVFDMDKQRNNLLKSYWGKVSKATSPLVGARFVHVEKFLESLADVQIAGNLPMAKMAK